MQCWVWYRFLFTASPAIKDTNKTFQTATHSYTVHTSQHKTSKTMGPSRNNSAFPRPSTWAERNSYVPGQTLASASSMSGVKTIPADAPKSERHVANVLNQGASYGWKGPGNGLHGSGMQGAMWAHYETKTVDFQKLDELDTHSPANNSKKQTSGGPAAVKPETFTWVTPSQEEKGDALGSARGKIALGSSTTGSKASSTSS